MEVDEQLRREVFTQQPAGMHSGLLSEISATYKPYIERLFSNESATIIDGLKIVKNLVIGNNKHKNNFVVLGIKSRLVYLLQQSTSSLSMKIHCVVILGSLAKGMNAGGKSLINDGVWSVMVSGLQQPDLRLYEACLRCVRTILTSGNSELLYDDPVIIPILLQSVKRSMCVQECTCEIIAHCCKSVEHQEVFHNHGVVPCLIDLLTSNIPRVKAKALLAVSALCYKNINVCQSMLEGKADDVSAIKILTDMLSRGQPVDIQINAAKCLTFIYRSGIAVNFDKMLVPRKVLPCLIRMCDASRNVSERVAGASTVAYLMEASPELQCIAFVCEQFPQKLAAYFSPPTVTDMKNVDDMRRFKDEMERKNDLLEAVFTAYAALLANDEDSRDSIVTDNLVKHVIEGLKNGSSPVRIAALLCLLSLSRSVRILRTIFEDLEVWKSVLTIIRPQNQDVCAIVPTEKEIVIASGLVCNLLLGFSPCKSRLVDVGLLDILKSWCCALSCVDLQRNGTWGFFNVTFQAGIDVNSRVMALLDGDTVFNLITSRDYDVLVKTFGVLNNVLANLEYSDQIMFAHGDMIMQACMVVVESTSRPSPNPWSGLKGRNADCAILTHVLCVFGCVAAADEDRTVRKHLHDNPNVFSTVVSCLSQPDDELQAAALDCIYKLCRGLSQNATERREKFKSLGVTEPLLHLLAVSSGSVSEKVKETLSFVSS